MQKKHGANDSSLGYRKGRLGMAPVVPMEHLEEEF
jgi:hypothetical protein